MRSTNVRLWLRAQNGITNNRQYHRSPTCSGHLNIRVNKNRGQRRESGFTAIGQLVMNTNGHGSALNIGKHTRHDTDVEKIVPFCATPCHVSVQALPGENGRRINTIPQ